MSFRDSVSPDITESLPFPFTAAGSAAASAFPADPRFDINLGGLGFILRASAERPYQRAPEASSKQRVDTAAEAGEQSLSSWWIRSQVSWHLGAGITYYDPGTDAQARYRFQRSHNVNVWTQGEAFLLPKMESSQTVDAAAYASTVLNAGVPDVVVAYDDAVSPGGALSSGQATQPAVAGTDLYIGHLNAVSLLEDPFGSPAITQIRTTTGVARCWWVKSRLFTAVGPDIYWVDLSTTSGTLPVPSADDTVWTHPDAAWTWTDIVASGDAILLAGHGESRSAVYSVTVTESGGVPEFTAPAEVAELPPGELAKCMGSYLSTYIVLGTTRGVRVGILGDGGQVQVGQLTLETDEPVVDVTFADRFAYLPVTRQLEDGTSGVVRIDLSQQIPDTSAYAWAYDVSTGSTDDAYSVALFGTDYVPAVTTATDVWSSTSDPADEGWIESGRLRYNTTEMKSFRLFRTSGELNGGSVEVYAATPDGVETRLIAYDPSVGMEGESAINVPRQRPVEYVTIRHVLMPSAGGDSPVLNGYTVKAIPAVRKARLYQYPLSCFDFEVDRNGARVGGYAGSAYDRVVELEEAETRALPMMVKDNRTGEAYVGTVESVEFAGTASPERSNQNFGGVLTVTMRRL